MASTKTPWRQLQVLLVLQAKPGEALGIAELALIVGVCAENVRSILGRLEGRGYARSRSAGRGRLRLYTLTTKGAAFDVDEAAIAMARAGMSRSAVSALDHRALSAALGMGVPVAVAAPTHVHRSNE